MNSPDYLRHFTPSNHPEGDWPDVISHIPKAPEQYGEQRKFIEKTFKKHNRKLDILDVGAGDGSFTSTVLDLLPQHLRPKSVCVVEKEKVLFAKLEEKVPGATRLLLPNAVAELPEDSAELLAAVDSLALANPTKYDLIIASHVTYYFDNAGATLAYALASRLLKEDGILWLISRDRSCALYQEREHILQEALLPDVNRHSFSDSLVDRVNCLWGLPNEKFSISTRDSQLQMPEAPGELKKFLGYILWLENLSEANIISLKEKTDFSESHIFLPRIERMAGELRLLQKLDVVGDCIDVLRRQDPHVQVHRVSLAGVNPDASVKELRRDEPDLPSLAPKDFKIRSVGFAHYPGETLQDTTRELLENFFFKNHTSFLFYPRFYYDYQVSNTDLSTVKRIAGSPKVSDTKSYKLRDPKLGLEVSDAHSSDSNEGNRFQSSVDAWVQALGEVYCEPTSENVDDSMWAICVAATVAADVSRPFKGKNNDLNECCALFLTVSSTRDLGALTQHVVPHIRVRLTQWLGHKFFVGSQAKLADLKKQAQMLNVIQRPLRHLSEVLGAMQSDTQEIRAILLEPEEALFASHAEIAPFFVQGEFIEFKRAGIRGVEICHTPSDYNDKPPEHLQLILAGILCAIFGELDLLKKQRTRSHIIAEAQSILEGVERSPVTQDIVKDLKWLVGLKDETEALVSLVPSAPDATWQKKAIEALENIKSALYTPFKPETLIWPKLAFDLLLRDIVFADSTKKAVEMNLESSPLPLAAVLSFIRDIATAQRRICSFDIRNNEKEKTVTMQWPEKQLDLISGHLISCLERVLSAPREWRIESANHGDCTRPFVLLANRLIGIGEEWHVETLTAPEVLAVQNGFWRYSILICNDAIVHKWSKV